MKDDVPYAIDFLNPAPDFERDRITGFYFEMVVEKMARLVIDRALNGAPSNPWPRWGAMLGVGAAAGFTGAPRATAHTATASVTTTVSGNSRSSGRRRTFRGTSAGTCGDGVKTACSREHR